MTQASAVASAGHAKRQSISQTLAALRAKGQIALMPFVPAGYPDLETTALTLQAMERAGASIVEVGIPFSDPIADGPVIQEAFTRTLEKKIRLADIFKSIGAVRPTISIPLVAMVSYSIVFRHGVARFLTNAKMSGFDGLIIPDLPPPEAQRVCDQVRAAGLDTILMTAPSTAESRRAQIGALSSGFIYYLSVAGITGERKDLPCDLIDAVTRLKRLTGKPVCVGFGIHLPEHVRQLQGVADGAIVGSAVVRRMTQKIDQGPQVVADTVESYCRELLSLVR